MERIQKDLNKKLEKSEEFRIQEELRLKEEMLQKVKDKEKQLKEQLEKRVSELTVAKENIEKHLKGKKTSASKLFSIRHELFIFDCRRDRQERK